METITFKTKEVHNNCDIVRCLVTMAFINREEKFHSNTFLHYHIIMRQKIMLGYTASSVGNEEGRIRNGM
jgi:hypothetical protein